MTTTPNLPPEFTSGNSIPVERATITRERMAETQLAAYQAGRDAALEEAAHVPRAYAMRLDSQGWGNRFPDELTAIFNASTNMADSIRALKSDTKGGV